MMLSRTTPTSNSDTAPNRVTDGAGPQISRRLSGEQDARLSITTVAHVHPCHAADLVFYFRAWLQHAAQVVPVLNALAKRVRT